MEHLRSIVAAFIILCLHIPCAAETIYLKNGCEIKKKITNRTKDTIWVGQGGGSVGIDTKKIDKILDDSGSLSIFDMENMAAKIRSSIASKNYGQAREYCDLFLKAAPGNADMVYLSAFLSQKIGDVDSAARRYRELIDLGSAKAPVYNNLGVICARQGKYSQAQSMFEKAVSLDASRQEYQDNLANVLKQARGPR